MTYVAGCLFRVMGLCAHALHGYAGRWLVNEKGAVDSAGRLPQAPPNFAVRPINPLSLHWRILRPAGSAMR